MKRTVAFLMMFALLICKFPVPQSVCEAALDVCLASESNASESNASGSNASASNASVSWASESDAEEADEILLFNDLKDEAEATASNADVARARPTKTEKENTKTAVITLGAEVNEVYEPFGYPTFLFLIESDTGAYGYRILTLDSEQLSDSVSVYVEPGHIYRIREIPVSRYRLEQIQMGNHTVLSPEEETITVDLTDDMQAEAIFVNEITQYEKFSHVFR